MRRRRVAAARNGPSTHRTPHAPLDSSPRPAPPRHSASRHARNATGREGGSPVPLTFTPRRAGRGHSITLPARALRYKSNALPAPASCEGCKGPAGQRETRVSLVSQFSRAPTEKRIGPAPHQAARWDAYPPGGRLREGTRDGPSTAANGKIVRGLSNWATANHAANSKAEPFPELHQ